MKLPNKSRETFYFPLSVWINMTQQDNQNPIINSITFQELQFLKKPVKLFSGFAAIW